ncbi:PAS domain-containing sensor histidine kinase [Tistrella bauzanensis]|uniref:histidine kinase n=1 Tax=Tistrella bauzanensis TaxID=657419 RepID=A0ABQ1ICL2_9PROT|nr:PAS domain S-box protein [Tistrella bauzanensis]GGB33084.1 PAS domain-containing sensor histidine kinase [Tistrella bauzanensis]
MAIDPIALNRMCLRAAAAAGGHAEAIRAWAGAIGDAFGAARVVLWLSAPASSAVQCLVDWSGPQAAGGGDSRGGRTEQVVRLAVRPRPVLLTLTMPGGIVPIDPDLVADLAAQLQLILNGMAADERARLLAGALDAVDDGVLIVEARPVDGPPSGLTHASRHFGHVAPFAALPPPLDRPGVVGPLRAAIGRSLASGQAERVAVLDPRADGDAGIARLDISCLAPSGLFAGGWMAVLRDPEGGRQGAEAAEARERMFRALYDANPVPMWIYDEHNLRLLSVNEAMVTKYGYDAHTLLGMSLLDLRPAEDVPAVMQVLSTRARAHEVSGPWRHRAANGDTFHVEIVTHRLEWEGRAAILTAAFDITERELANRVLRMRQADSDRLLRVQSAILDSIPAVVWLLDAAGNVVAMNRAWHRLAADLGDTAPEIRIGQDFRGRRDGFGGAGGGQPGPGGVETARSLPAGMVQAVLSVLSGQKSEASHDFPVMVGTATRWFQTTVTAVVDAQGLPGGAVVMSIDISAMKRAQFDILAAQNRAIAASAAKSLFLAHMSHELRTPLNAVIGFADVIEGEMLGPVGVRTYKDYAGHVSVAGRHLLQVIDGLLDLANIETGSLIPDRQPVDLAQIVAEAAAACGTALRRHGARLDLLTQGSAAMEADPRLLSRMVQALIDNAARHGREGGCVRVRVDGTDIREVLIDIVDDGPGIAAERLHGLTEPFATPSGDVRTATSGVGLGLPLARHYAELHGGRLELVDRQAAGGGGETGLAVRVVLPRHPGT